MDISSTYTEDEELTSDFPWVKDGITEEESYALDYLYRILEEYPEFGEAIFPWVKDDITEEESYALDYLYRILEKYPEFGEAVFPWVKDGITEEESYALNYLYRILEEYPEFGEAVFPWVKDGITWEERHALKTLRRILEEYPEFGKAVLGLWWVGDDMPTVRRYALMDLLYLVEINPALAWQAIGEPFMGPPFRYRDQYALNVLLSLARDGSHSDERHALLAQLTSQTWFSDGLDDLDAALLYAISMSSNDFRQALIEDHYVASEAVELPLSGNVDTIVIRHTPFPPDDHTFAAMEEGLRAIEEFMGAPFPVNDIILVLTDPDIWSVGGRHWAFLLGDYGKPGHMTAFMAINDSDLGPSKGTIYHEIGHYYFLNGTDPTP